MTTPENVVAVRSRSATILSGTLRVAHIIMLICGYAALALSFKPYHDDHPSDEWFRIVFFASTGLVFGIIALLCATVPLKKNWWHRRWLHPTLALLSLCFLRAMITAYFY